jgi:hypothetical protein
VCLSVLIFSGFDFNGKENILLKAAFTNPEYAQGRLLYVPGGDLISQVFDASSGKFGEEEKQVVSVVTEEGATWRASFTVSSNGLLAYAGGKRQSQLGWYDRTDLNVRFQFHHEPHFLALSDAEREYLRPLI